MSAAILVFPAAETPTHCGGCGKGIDSDHQIAFECPECGTWTCKNEACLSECDRLALIVKRSLERLYPSVWTRVRRCSNRGI
jgi:predicted RNA-binding Zn-ribbon protein involved in translation (DUF1610 family)